MNLYIAKLIFNINIESTNLQQEVHQFDEQTRIIKALTLDNAFTKARLIGKKEENTFIDQSNKQVTWKFIDVIELYSIQNMQDGEQLYGQTHEMENVDTFIEYAKHKSMIIQTRF
ncbi:MAG: DUF4288 domain-containing protein [Bacteroidia bacterium]